MGSNNLHRTSVIEASTSYHLRDDVDTSVLCHDSLSLDLQVIVIPQDSFLKLDGFDARWSKMHRDAARHGLLMMSNRLTGSSCHHC